MSVCMVILHVSGCRPAVPAVAKAGTAEERSYFRFREEKTMPLGKKCGSSVSEGLTWALYCRGFVSKSAPLSRPIWLPYDANRYAKPFSAPGRSYIITPVPPVELTAFPPPTVNGDSIKNTQPRSSRLDPAGSATNPTGPDAQEDAKPSGAAVAAIQDVNLPPFWPNSPSTWFLQVEAHFRLRQITSQQARHWHLVSCLPPDVADDLADILASPHPSHPYDTLKAAIISRKSEFEHSRLQQLITATELGYRRPSQLLRRMRQLLGGPSAPQEEKLLRELFLQRLPQSMIPVLVAAGDVPLDTLAEMADRVADYSQAHNLNAVTTPPPATAADPALASIENRLDALVRRLDDFVPAHRRPSSRFQIHSRSLTPPRSPELRPPDAPRDVSSSTVFWYHRRFSASARKCTRPCSWSGNATTGH
ncbi:hypothetical protein HPB51_023958 [Rhipicephalus microplus]|uniref:DUF7041 domain-containing protein n=1 Tax=Rhipicephalus microplus TaxID=6941 RepID=A0A9J6DRG3_RHIMP|nr:hypothetical protein HPB51_023958 [Rhipicephalus microplus]